MESKVLQISGKTVKTVTLEAAVIGSGAAGYSAALNLYNNNITDIALITEGINMGTSRNTGSDKQTYYKLSLCGERADSVHEMANDLFSYGCVDGDIALAEASMSVPCFINLCKLGVPFPTNRYGEFVGYKTDHDPRERATSAGPLTSKMMTECLQKEFESKKIRVFDGELLIFIVKDGETAAGFITLNRKARSLDGLFTLYNCRNIVMATGGPAGIYNDSVYPLGHTGSNGVAFEAGAMGKNLTEWQYGLASVNPRWNVSGTYMQVLPKFVSIDENGKEHEFLADYFKDSGKMLSAVFKKGYEWPFDSRKALKGSSVIDLLVYIEKNILSRKVYLDFRNNPFNAENLDYNSLEKEAYDYLCDANALFGKPIDRLMQMNSPAFDLYLSKGVDLKREMLEISLCAQHNNGGIDVDMWWQSSIKGLFVVGEAAGTHGIYRPGGSALNAGQAGAARAALYISRHLNLPLPLEKAVKMAEKTVLMAFDFVCSVLSDTSNAKELKTENTLLMDKFSGAIRNPELLKSFKERILNQLKNLDNILKVSSLAEMFEAFKIREMLISQYVYTAAMSDYAASGAKTRGSALYTSESGEKPENLAEIFRFEADNGEHNNEVRIARYKDFECEFFTRNVRPVPEGGGFFENVWKDFRENGNVY